MKNEKLGNRELTLHCLNYRKELVYRDEDTRRGPSVGEDASSIDYFKNELKVILNNISKEN